MLPRNLYCTTIWYFLLSNVATNDRHYLKFLIMNSYSLSFKGKIHCLIWRTIWRSFNGPLFKECFSWYFLSSVSNIVRQNWWTNLISTENHNGFSGHIVRAHNIKLWRISIGTFYDCNDTNNPRLFTVTVIKECHVPSLHILDMCSWHKTLHTLPHSSFSRLRNELWEAITNINSIYYPYSGIWLDDPIIFGRSKSTIIVPTLFSWQMWSRC